MNRILCPIDFSETSLNAVEFAARVGEKFNSAVTLLYVFNEIEFNKILKTESAGKSFKQLMALAERRLEGICNEVSKTTDGESLVSCDHTVQLGKLSDTIVDYADNNKYNFIVMGTNGVSDVREALVGSNTINVIDKANCPVLCVPREAGYSDFRKVVYATDFLEEDKNAIQHAISFAVGFNSRISVLHVSRSDEKVESEQYKDFIRDLQSFIQYEKIGFDNRIYEDDIPRTIENYLDTEDADLLILLRRNMSFFEKLFHKSVTRKLSYFTNYPILALKL